MSQTDMSIPERSLLSSSPSPARHSQPPAYVTASTHCWGRAENSVFARLHDC